MEGKLRIGLAEQTIITALAHAAVLSDPGTLGFVILEASSWSDEKKTRKTAESVQIVKQVYSEIPNYDKIVPVLLEHGVEKLPEYCKLTPGNEKILKVLGIPLKPMLAHPTKAISEVLDRFENMSFTCEYKYDGERAQVLDQPLMIRFTCLKMAKL